MSKSIKERLSKKLPMSPEAYTNFYGTKEDQYRVCEEFYSVQGEGQLAGTWAYFIRFSECNLRCSWCDTKFSYAKPGETGEWVSTKTLLRRVQEKGAKFVVLTGGEPCLQPNLEHLVTTLRNNRIHVTIETNSTIRRPDVTPDLWSLSPKLQSAKGVFYEREDIEWFLTEQSQPVQLKFVIIDENDFTEMIELLDEIKDNEEHALIEYIPIYTQPDGYREDYVQAILETIELSQKYMKNYDIRPLHQFHRLVWGADSIGV